MRRGSPAVIGGVPLTDRDEHAATGGGHLLGRPELGLDGHLGPLDRDGTRPQVQRLPQRCRRPELDVELRGDRAWRYGHPCLSHQRPGRGPVAVTIEERAHDAPVDHTLEGLVVVLRAKRRDDLLPLDEALDTEPLLVGGPATEALVPRGVGVLEALGHHLMVPPRGGAVGRAAPTTCAGRRRRGPTETRADGDASRRRREPTETRADGDASRRKEQELQGRRRRPPTGARTGAPARSRGGRSGTIQAPGWSPDVPEQGALLAQTRRSTARAFVAKPRPVTASNSSTPRAPIPNVLAARYASRAMAALWSPENKIVLERQLWLAVLEAQRELGVPVPDGVVDAYRAQLDVVDLGSIDARERVTRHDVKARIEEFCALAGHEHIHKGMTSRDLTENVEQMQVRSALELVRDRIVAALARLAKLSLEHAELVLAGRSHNVPAQATTVGKRIANSGEELLQAYHRVEDLLARYPLRGIKRSEERRVGKE